jgi:type II secretory pathway pseudopilin PulG
MEYANQRSASEKAKTQIALLSKGIEEYKLDMGGYPPTNNISGNLTSAGSSTSSIIFNALYFAPLSANQRIYLPELDPVTTKQGWTTGTATANLTITDPWGNQYCYRSSSNATGATNNATVNPDFDLWSMGKDSKTDATSGASVTTSPNADDIRNF